MGRRGSRRSTPSQKDGGVVGAEGKWEANAGKTIQKAWEVGRRSPRCIRTMVNISPPEICAMAVALEETRIPFLWSLKEDFHADFPPGFKERTSPQGKVVAWAPQRLVLGHPACGVHVTHCGYNSVFESIAGRVPMICRPIWADNMINGRMIEDFLRIGVKADGGNGVITTESMERCLRMVLGGGEEGRTMRERIAVLREKLVAACEDDGSSAKDLRSLLEMIASCY